jgi:hypothetical protein
MDQNKENKKQHTTQQTDLLDFRIDDTRKKES